MVGGTSVVFTLKAVVDETFIRKSSNISKLAVGVEASHTSHLFYVSGNADKTFREIRT